MKGKLKEVEHYFNTHTGRYGNRTEERFRDIPTFLTKNVKDGSLLLDIGCGKGEFLNYIMSNYNYFIYGIDISKKMLSFSSGTQSNLVQGEANKLPFKSDTFDVIYMDTVIHHIVSNSYLDTVQLQKGAIKEALRVLKTHGYLIIQELYYDFVYSIGPSILFYHLLTTNKIGIPPAPGEPKVIIAIRTKKGWDQFMDDFSDVCIPIKINVYPHHTELKFKLLGIKEIGNIMYHFRKKSAKS